MSVLCECLSNIKIFLFEDENLVHLRVLQRQNESKNITQSVGSCRTIITMCVVGDIFRIKRYNFPPRYKPLEENSVRKGPRTTRLAIFCQIKKLLTLPVLIFYLWVHHVP